MSNCIERDTCRLCHSRDLVMALDLGAMPLGDEFVTAAELDSALQPEFDVRMMLCRECGQVQLSNVVSPDSIYKRYTYLTSVSRGLVEHFVRYADSMLGRFDAPGFAVEIGSNEGAMLRHIQSRGWRVLGVDPADSIAKAATAGGVETWAYYFTTTAAAMVKELRGKADLIIANNVIANIDDLDDIAEGVRFLLAPDGLFVMETSYLLDVVQGALIDTIFSEHISYLAVRPLRAFFAQHGLEMIDAERTAPKGGSLRCTVQLAGGPRPVSARVETLAVLETQAGLFKRDVYYKMERRLVSLRGQIRDVVCNAFDNAYTVAAWGAADGGTSMLYYFRLGEYLRYLIDDNPVKVGTFSPGLHLPVVSAEMFANDQPDMIVMLAWRYADAIIAAHPEYGGKWVMPLPRVKVL